MRSILFFGSTMGLQLMTLEGHKHIRVPFFFHNFTAAKEHYHTHRIKSWRDAYLADLIDDR